MGQPPKFSTPTVFRELLFSVFSYGENYNQRSCSNSSRSQLIDDTTLATRAIALLRRIRARGSCPWPCIRRKHMLACALTAAIAVLLIIAAVIVIVKNVPSGGNSMTVTETTPRSSSPPPFSSSASSKISTSADDATSQWKSLLNFIY